MSRRLIVVTTCPLCGKHVQQIPDHVLKKEPHPGHKQYIHTNCWNKMIAEKRPYSRKAVK